MEIAALPKDKKIILFDGVCNLCNSAVQFVIKHDTKDTFRFVALQSELGQKITTYIGINPNYIDSFILYEPGKAYYYKADAAFEVMKDVGGVYNLLRLFRVLPKGFTNFIYDYVAKNRYRWYGKRESCMVPTTELSAKFLT